MATATEKPHHRSVAAYTSLDQFVPDELREIGDPQTALPRIAKDERLTALIGSIVPRIPTTHDLYLGDSRRRLAVIPADSVHLVVTSPPYWTLKEYRQCDRQLGYIEDYEQFLSELDTVWPECWRVLLREGVCRCGRRRLPVASQERRQAHPLFPFTLQSEALPASACVWPSSLARD